METERLLAGGTPLDRGTGILPVSLRAILALTVPAETSVPRLGETRMPLRFAAPLGTESAGVSVGGASQARVRHFASIQLVPVPTSTFKGTESSIAPDISETIISRSSWTASVGSSKTSSS